MNFYERLMSFKSKEETLDAFAERLGVHVRSFSLWRFTGRSNCWPKIETVIKVAERLNTTPEWLLFGAKREEAS